MNKIIPWKELSRKLAFKKYGRKIEEVIFELPDGKESDFYVKKEGPATAILAITKDKEVILTKQFRPGPMQILNELPGGYIDEKETPEEAGARELLEETGYAGKIEFVTKAYDCAYSTMIRHCLVATECEKVQGQTLDNTEFIEVLTIPLEEFRKQLRSGKMTDLEVAYLGLDYLDLL